MGKKHRHQHQPGPSSAPASLETKALQELIKGRFRDARETYKILCKQDRAKYLPCLIEANQRLADQLLERGQLTEAGHVLEHLKTIAPAASLLIFDLQAALKAERWDDAFQLAGRLWKDTGGSAPERERLIVADALVLAFRNGDGGDDAIPVALQSELLAVVEALRCVSEKRYEAAQETLRPLARSSIFAAWKILIKGWVAFYTGDRAKAAVLFGQLPPGGVPDRAALPFRVLFIPGGRLEACGSALLREQAVKQACGLLGRPTLGPALLRAEAFWVSGKGSDAYLEVRATAGFPSEQADLNGVFSEFFFKVESILKGRFRENYLEYFGRFGRHRNFKDLNEARWITGMLGRRELADHYGEDDLDFFWREYLKVTPEDYPLRSKIASIVLERVGSLYAKERPKRPSYFFDRDEKAMTDPQRAIVLLKESIGFDPTNLAACLKLLEVYEFEEDEKAGNRLLDEMTARFPREKSVLVRAGNRCVARCAFVKGLEYLERAHALDSLDPEVLQGLVNGYIGQARQYFEKRKAALGRKAFQLVRRHATNVRYDIQRGIDYLDARHGVLELTYGDRAEGERLIGAAGQSTHSLPALLLFLHAFSRACERSTVSTGFLEGLSRISLARTDECLAVYRVLLQARVDNPKLDWDREAKILSNLILSVAAKAFDLEHTVGLIPLFAKDPAFEGLVGKLIEKGLQMKPTEPRLRLFAFLNRRTKPMAQHVVELEELHEDLRRAGFPTEEGMAARALEQLRSAYYDDVEEDPDDLFS